MKTAIIIHGYNTKEEYKDASRPTPSNDHFLPWIQKELTLREVLTQTPEMPGFWEPNYDEWKENLDRFVLDEETILIGHSCGGGFLVRYLSEKNISVGKVVLVAPWFDPNKEINPKFFEFEIDKNLASRTKGLVVMYSTDDEETVLISVKMLKEKLVGVHFQEFKDKGHFCLGDLGTVEFPELLENLV